MKSTFETFIRTIEDAGTPIEVCIDQKGFIKGHAITYGTTVIMTFKMDSHIAALNLIESLKAAPGISLKEFERKNDACHKCGAEPDSTVCDELQENELCPLDTPEPWENCSYSGFYQAGTEECDFCEISEECAKATYERFMI